MWHMYAADFYRSSLTDRPASYVVVASFLLSLGSLGRPVLHIQHFRATNSRTRRGLCPMLVGAIFHLHCNCT